MYCFIFPICVVRTLCFDINLVFCCNSRNGDGGGEGEILKMRDFYLKLIFIHSLHVSKNTEIRYVKIIYIR